jgi:hypothetical protein
MTEHNDAAFELWDAIFAPRSSNSRQGRGRPRDEGIRHDLTRLVAEAAPCSVRQAFYQASVAGLVPKIEAGYDKVKRLLTELRREGTVPWEHIADNTRWMRKPTTYSSAADGLLAHAAAYRRDLLDAKGGENIEVWLEKDALAGVIYEVTERWDVPLMVTRGYASLSFLHSAAMSIRAWADQGVPTSIYYFGDHDPSGRDIDRQVEEELRRFAAMETGEERLWLHFERVAVTEEQIVEWHLPTRPTKASDSRARRFMGDSVELDAISAPDLRALVDEVIAAHIDIAILKQLQAIEASEREVLAGLAVSLVEQP